MQGGEGCREGGRRLGVTQGERPTAQQGCEGRRVCVAGSGGGGSGWLSSLHKNLVLQVNPCALPSSGLPSLPPSLQALPRKPQRRKPDGKRTARSRGKHPLLVTFLWLRQSHFTRDSMLAGAKENPRCASRVSCSPDGPGGPPRRGPIPLTLHVGWWRGWGAGKLQKSPGGAWPGPRGGRCCCRACIPRIPPHSCSAWTLVHLS